jgi:hypothetical protein
VIALRRTQAWAALAFSIVAFACAATPPAASALNPIKPVCGVAGFVNGLLGKACSVVQNGGRWVKAGKKLLSGNVGGAAKTVLGEGGGRAASAATAAVGFAAIASGVLGGAKLALTETATVLGHTTSPQLGTTWFSSTYWRIAGISAVLTMPFLFAAAIQALMRSDLALLVRATLGYLPLAMLAVSVAAPVTMLLLAASDQLSSVVSSAAGDASGHFLRQASVRIGELTLLSLSPFLAIMVGLFIVCGALALWIELLMREAAVYVIVLMLPLAFAAMVWPARRIWAIRAVELLVALILSKFAIVAVLSLGSAALNAGTGHGLTGALAGAVLLIMGAFAPWALLRLLPLAELASSAAGSLRSEMRGGAVPSLGLAEGTAQAGDDWATAATAQMRRDASDASDASDAADEGRAGDATSRPPARDGDVDVLDDRVRPQGGQEVASPAAPEDREPVTRAEPASGAEPASAAQPASGAEPDRGPKLDPAPATESSVTGAEDPGPSDGQPSVAASAAIAAPAATAATTPPERSDSEDQYPVLQDMLRDEHRGDYKLALDDAPPPPPDIERP